MSKRACIVCSKQGNLIFSGGCLLDALGIQSSRKFCKFVVALKTLAPDQKIMSVELNESRAIILDNLRFLTCIVCLKVSSIEKYELIFELYQIAHLLDLYYSIEIDRISYQEMETALETARTYSASTEINFAGDCTGDFFEAKEFSDFASNYAERLLGNQPLCSEWANPLLTAPGILNCSLLNYEGWIFELPGRQDISEQFSRLLCCAHTKSLVFLHARELMGNASDSNDGPFISQEASNVENSVLGSQSHCMIYSDAREGYRVVNLASISMYCYHVCLFIVPNGPMGRKLCLVVYCSNNTENICPEGKFFTNLRSETPPGISSSRSCI